MNHLAQQLPRRRGRGSGPWPPPLVVPREHGAWAMWIMPGIVGAVLAGVNYHLSALLLFAALLLFVGRYPISVWARSRTRSLPLRAASFNLVIGLAGLALTIGLAAVYQRWALFGFGALAALVMALHLRLATTQRERSVAAELLGIVGLGLTGPATYYTASGDIDTQAALSWLLPALFFGTSVFSVKLRVEGYARIKTGKRLRTLAAALAGYQAMATTTVVLLASLGAVTPWVMGAYVPVTVQAIWLARNLKTPPNLKRLGLLWVGHSVLFAILLVALM